MRRQYGRGPTSVAALSVGGSDATEREIREQAVETVVDHLRERSGNVVGVSIPILKDIAWKMDSTTTGSSHEQWQTYLRPALASLDTVENLGSRWRWTGENGEGNAVLTGEGNDETNLDKVVGVAAATGVDLEAEAGALGADAKRAGTDDDPDAFGPTRAALRAEATARSHGGPAGPDADADRSARTCARCGEVQPGGSGMVAPPPLHGKTMMGEGKVCAPCFKLISQGID